MLIDNLALIYARDYLSKYFRLYNWIFTINLWQRKNYYFYFQVLKLRLRKVKNFLGLHNSKSQIQNSHRGLSDTRVHLHLYFRVESLSLRMSQARMLEWVAISFSRGSSWLRNWTHVSCTGRRILHHWATREGLSTRSNAQKMLTFRGVCVSTVTYTPIWLCAAAAAKSLQSCPTLCDPIDSSPLGSSVPGSLQARILEWVAISFSNAWKWKVKVKSFSRVWPSATP